MRIADLVASLFLGVERRSDTDGISTNTGRTQLGNVGATKHLLLRVAAAIVSRQ